MYGCGLHFKFPKSSSLTFTQAIAVEMEIRKAAIALSELEYEALIIAMTGCARKRL